MKGAYGFTVFGAALKVSYAYAFAFFYVGEDFAGAVGCPRAWRCSLGFFYNVGWRDALADKPSFFPIVGEYASFL